MVTGKAVVMVLVTVEVTVDVAVTCEPAACLGRTAAAVLRPANEARTVKTLIVNAYL